MRHRLDARPEDLRHVRAVVEAEGDDGGRDGRQDDAGLREREVDEEDLEEQRRAAEERDVEARDAVQIRIARQPTKGTERREDRREEDRRDREEQGDRDAEEDERDRLFEERRVDADREQDERDERDDDDSPRGEELGTPPPPAALTFLRDLGDQHLVR